MTEGFVSPTRKLLWQAGLLALIAAFWQFGPAMFDISPLTLPRLSDSLAAAAGPLTGDGTLVGNALVTLVEVTAAFVIAGVLGIAVGLVIGSIEPVRRVATPLLMAAFAVPLMVLIPLFLVGMGLGISSKIAFGAVYAFFPAVFNTVVGVGSVQETHLSVARAFGLSRLDTMRKVVVRSAARNIMNGLQMSISMAIIAVLSIEMFGSVAGLGYLIQRAGHRMRIDEVYGLILVVLVIAIALLAVVKLLGRAVNVRLEASID
ncbi:ABC transporter permease [Pseudactinotalea sp. HY158]|uniref:ABC transporter permease n=1 Tax=Pseudactinotalea sp. HY158 TaxID=2654547 RepID=UPI00129C9FC8|nr:ABC transporter permease [Pseudactinotalea sp. HY158]QGH70694.1 ABC transporter permease subunit [Pseudactinotalea sp. HY158]